MASIGDEFKTRQRKSHIQGFTQLYMTEIMNNRMM